ncbi:maltose/moltooligosaccharide transporter [Alysiella filiformis DSM 16848]|uniref:Maltose/moltooligosaccharide transporter n=2 Tax=Alysiella TaxID=194195 RepID=A0A286EDV1_9NEIS|nr:maltose/moltooligosaccharide transporter [Alysiella filiformis DSM 16848]
MNAQQVHMTLRQIMLMNFGFFGIQYSFGLQQSAVGPIYLFLNADAGQLPILNLAGPITGLIVQPIIGAMSDRTWVEGKGVFTGRRRPYFMWGAIGCSIALLLFPHVTALWMAVLMLWILDIANNTAMEPYRAFVADAMPTEQQNKGFLMQSMFTGLGAVLAYLSLPLFQKVISGQSDAGIPYWVYGSFYLGAVLSIGSVLVSVLSTPEPRLSEQEIAAIRAKPSGFVNALTDIAVAIKEMPKPLRFLALIYLFQWYALFIYWQFVALSVAQSAFGSTDVKSEAFQAAVAWNGYMGAFYNFITFLSAFGLMALTKKYAAKYVHAVALFCAAVGLMALPFIENKFMLFVPMLGMGVAWASIMGVPFLIAVAEVPKARYGVYMGIINMMIVIPMFIQTLTFGTIYDNLLGSNPANAIMMAGVMLGIAGILSLFIQTKQSPIK